MTSPGPRIPKRYFMLRLRPTAWPAAERTTPLGDPVVPVKLELAFVYSYEIMGKQTTGIYDIDRIITPHSYTISF